MSTWSERIGSLLFFSKTDDALSAERARNEEARAKLAAARVRHGEKERAFEAAVKNMDGELLMKRDAYAKQAKPMLAEFDEIAVAQHYYTEVKEGIASQESVVKMMAERELGEFGYMSKKLISVALNYRALEQQLEAGAPFEDELRSVLADAESEDLDVLATPLKVYSRAGVPDGVTVRTAAFNMARAIEETGKSPAQEPVGGWLDFIKFRTAFSPTTAEMNQARSRKMAADFMRHIEAAEYPQALDMAEKVFGDVERSNDAAGEYFTDTYRAFRRTVVPKVASEIFLAYASASLDASRFACVKSMLQE